MVSKTEAAIQQECVMWLRNNYCLAHHSPRYIMFSVPNEGIDPKEQSRKKAIGLLNGVSDTIIDTGKALIYCEFKDEKGRQTPAQVEFQSRVETLGREYWLVRSLEQFKEMVSKII